MKKQLAAKVGLLVMTLLISLTAGEIAFRMLTTIPRVLMFNSEAFKLDSAGAVRYLPNKNIRTAAVYNGKIEYDVTFQTNNLGFIDNKDYGHETNSNKRYYAFVGDSFTAGYHGGVPWVPKLSREMKNKNTEIYNLGIDGAGFEHFYRLLKSVKSQVGITHIVIMAISNDFSRQFWYPLTTTSEIRFCQENQQPAACLEHSPTALVIPATSSKENLIAAANDYFTKTKKESITNVKKLLRQSYLLRFVDRKLKESITGDGKELISSNLESLRKIKNEFPKTEIHLVHLPSKEEVIKGEYLLKNMRESVEGMGVTYFPALKECEWSIQQFLVQDGHPNSNGYENISKCVSQHLFPDK